MNDFLKDYHIIDNMPYGLDFHNQGLRQLRTHSKWFFENKDQRLTALQNAYHAFSGKYLDFTPESLKDLGEFFLQAIDTKKLPPEVYKAIRAQYPPEIQPDDFILTSRSRSLIIDVGIYFGEVMIRNHKDMFWHQDVSKKKIAADRGYMVITINPKRFDSDMNPMWLMAVQGSKVTHNEFLPSGIYDIYEVWCEMVAPEYML